MEVVDSGRLLYTLQHTRPQENSQTLAFVFDVAKWEGDLRIADPDRLVLRALARREAIATLEARLPWRTNAGTNCRPLARRSAARAVWLYRQEELILCLRNDS